MRFVMYFAICLMIIALMILSPSAGATVYKWVDSKGKVHYSDSPKDGAKIVKPSANTQNQISLNSPHISSHIVSQTETNSASNVHYQLEILSPQDDATIRNNRGDFSVTTSIKPNLEGKHVWILYLDGKRYGEVQGHGRFSLMGIDRGSHRLKVDVLTQTGHIVASSPEITVYLHRFSVNFNKR
ncbi:MAG: DUF4124 domain-containing protein [Parashewanella sp.]